MFCPKCGKELQEDAAFCIGCGAAIGTKAKVCPQCGEEMDSDAMFCKNCGAASDVAPVSEPTVTESVAQPQEGGNAPSKINVEALVGLILSSVGLFGGNFLILLPSIIGLTFSILGAVRIKKYASSSSSTLAIVGLVISIVSFVLWLIVWIYAGFIMDTDKTKDVVSLLMSAHIY